MSLRDAILDRRMMPLRILVLAACACGPTVTRGPLGTGPLMYHVRVLADPRLDGREAGMEGEREAAQYVAGQLQGIGLVATLQPVGDSANLYALLPGASDGVIVIGAHLDHLGRHGGRLYRGADDDASGVAAVLGIAKTLVARRGELGRSVLFVWFGAEERGMVGSRYFVAHSPVALSRIAAMVNVDMIARPLQDQLVFRVPLHLFGVPRHRAVGLVGARRYPALRALADAAFAAEDGEIVAAEDLPDAIGREVEAQAQGRGDSVSFENRGIPSLFFGDGESSDYHQPGDTPERLDPDLFALRARAVARVVVALTGAPAETFAASERTPPKRKPSTGWYLPFGFSNGVRTGTGYVLGGEASLVHFSAESHAYAGVYADALRGDTWRYSVGPELGIGFVGLDAGYVADGARRGFAVRPFATISVLSVGARIGRLTDGWFGELDVLVKYPLAL